MPMLTVRGRPCAYATEGDGFPLLLTAGASGTIADWHEIMPLCGELCKAIAYEYHGMTGAEGQAEGVLGTDDLAALLEALGTERIYLAAADAAIGMALAFALQMPARLEGLLLIGMAEDPAIAALLRSQVQSSLLSAEAGGADCWSAMTVPTLILVGDQVPQHRQYAERLLTRLRRARMAVIPAAGRAPHREQPHRLGRAMMDFLMHCERQRNLVRGASFLL
jgi:pimeloyl-ACP methyl ester carboxylesterase